ncbi:helix-turn-helix transcriptional regulator [Roseomonas gilardii subsp. gilardii]|uniref:helix-turn-helix transcriptional regulator n=1 Tax=Roseomonas gilardii TaxID=257708 RepID=UPI001FFBAED9|nr:helix-turn-helix transcriptional regulator [Roseomonas gilardii]UPG72031.1 helix-turn-helix transcriptional regulator [Roseomonas gilardii subsp. gilardii]
MPRRSLPGGGRGSDLSLTDEDLDALTDRLYEAALRPDLWEGVFDELGRMMQVGDGGAGMVTIRQGVGFITSPSLKPVTEDWFAQGWDRRSDLPERLRRRDEPRFLQYAELYTRGELSADPHYQEFLRPKNLGWGAYSVIRLPDEEGLLFSIERQFSRGPLEDAQLRALDRLRPHLARAAALVARLGRGLLNRQIDLLEEIDLPAAVLGRGGRVLAANQALLGRKGAVPGAGDRLALPDQELERQVLVALDAISAGRVPPILSFASAARAEEPAVILRLLPLRRGAQEFFSGALALMVLNEVRLPLPPEPRLLQELFGLTPAQSRLARLLMQGHSLPQAAAATGLSRETLRTQLRAIFEKTGTGRQAELVALLSRLAPWTKPQRR